MGGEPNDSTWYHGSDRKLNILRPEEFGDTKPQSRTSLFTSANATESL